MYRVVNIPHIAGAASYATWSLAITDGVTGCTMPANISYIEESASSLVVTEGVVGCTALPADVLERGVDVVL